MKIAVIGGGVAGITACYNLSKKGKDIKITLIEKEKRLGGLAKSFIYEERFVFDIGPKRFHTDDKDVIEFLKEIGNHARLINIGRVSKVFFLDKYFSWPLSRKDLFKLPVGTTIKSILDLLFRKTYTPQQLLNFENFIVSKYGKTLYDHFFKSYTEKFLHLKSEFIHSDWASTGINRSIINKEHKGNSLIELAQQLLLPSIVDANFLYPEKNGFGSFWDTCASIMTDSGNVTVETDKTIQIISRRGDRLLLSLSDGRVMEFDYIFWSGKLTDLLVSINSNNTGVCHLPFIDTIFVDLVFKGDNIIIRDAICQWLYISSPKYKISRISMPKSFNHRNIPEGYQALCVEVTVPERAQDINDTIIKDVLDELTSLRIISGKAELYYSNVHREHATYPVYHRNYKEESSKAFEIIKRFSDAVIPIGRSGCFWYNNADHSIKQALFLTNALMDGRTLQFDFRKYFGGISETIN